MIDFMRKFVQSLSDAEVRHFFSVLSEESDNRLKAQAKVIGASAELCDEEKDLIFSGQIISAIRLYKARNGVGLAEARDVCETYRKQL